MARQWDIFCAVVDNYGDMGVCWRLARQLAAEYGLSVRLWVDDLNALRRLCPQVSGSDRQVIAGVELRHWPQAAVSDEPGAVVIEAFACTLPAFYVAAMAAQQQPPCWINLEYLSAEDWVEGCHGLPSLQAGGLRKFFYFPGFSSATGGLLREADLLARRAQWGAAEQDAWLAERAVVRKPGERLISLFTYEQSQLVDWLQRLVSDERLTLLLVPEGRVLSSLNSALGQALGAGDSYRQGALRVQVVPFMRQEDYDPLLWSCDLNLVRGEDSFVRAQWAGRPLLWHIYQQQDGAHLDKLEAFLQRYTQGLSDSAQAALRQWWRAWNDEQPLGEVWDQYLLHEKELVRHAKLWCQKQGALPDLAAGLVRFCSDWL